MKDTKNLTFQALNDKKGLNLFGLTVLIVTNQKLL